MPSDEEIFAARGFGNTIGFGERPVVLSIDFMKGFTDPAAPLGSELADELAAAKRVLTAARTAAVPIVHTVVVYEPGDTGLPGVWHRKQAGLLTLAANSEWVGLDDRVERRRDEPILVKKYASAFFGTDLSSRLTSGSIDTAILVGCTTSGCVRATAVDALQHGFRPIVAREAVGDRSAAAHDQALFDLAQKYADVESVERIVAYLER